MGWEAWITIAVVAGTLAVLATNRAPPDVTLVGGVIVLLLLGVIGPAQAFAGFSNEGVITIAVMYIIVAGLKDTGAVSLITQTIFGRPRSVASAQIRLLVPAAVVSAFLNNTPVVAMFIPAVQEWAKKYQISVSKLLLPLSYVAITGGMITLVGTSTNLIVNGLVIKQFGSSPLHLFDLAWVGIPVTIMAIAFIVATSRWLLPDRKPAVTQFLDNVRQYTVEVMVEANGPLVGKSIEAAGLRHLPGLYLAEIDRGGHLLTAVSPHEVLRGDDRLIFVGVADSVVDLRRIRGLIPATNQVFKLDVARSDRSLVEAVVSHRSPLVGKSVREGRFRSVYNAVIIAVARDGEQIKQKIGDIVLRAGDTLMLEASPEFANVHGQTRDFYLVSRIDQTQPPRHDKAMPAVFILVAMLGLAAGEVMSMLNAALLAGSAMLLFGCVSITSARNGIDWPILVAIAASFGLGAALQSSGVAAAIASGLLSAANGDPWITLVIIFFVTVIITELITNNAAAVLIFPIAMSAALELGVSTTPFIVAVMIAASTGFATPIGYQTNLMVFSPGGYRFSDYVKLGVPLDILIGIVTVLIVPVVWPFVTK